MLDVMYTNSSAQGPCISLAVRGVYNTTSEMSRFISLDDVDGLRSLFNNGHARPNDIGQTLGWSALRVSLSLMFNYRSFQKENSNNVGILSLMLLSFILLLSCQISLTISTQIGCR